VKSKNTLQTVSNELLSTATKITSTDCKDLEQYEQGKVREYLQLLTQMLVSVEIQSKDTK